MADVYAIDKQVYGADRIVSGSGVMVSIGGMINLAQSCNVSYNRQIQAVYELGTENVYAGATGAAGTVDITRFVGMGTPAMKTFEPDSPCKGTTITVQNGDATCGDKFGTLRSRNAMLQTIGVQAAANGPTVTENAQYWIGNLEAS